MSRHSGNLECKIYVGDLPRDASEKEVERVFSSYGRLRNVWVARNPPGFAFLEYEDPRDAEDAVKNLDGSTLCGGKIRVEHSTGKSRPKPWLRNQYGSGDRGRGDYYGGGRRPPARRPYDSRDKYGHAGSDYNNRGRASAGKRGSRSRSRSRSRGRKSYSRSPSRSRSREDRSRGRSRSKSRSAEKRPIAPPAAPSRSRSRSRRRRGRSGSSDESA